MKGCVKKKRKKRKKNRKKKKKKVEKHDVRKIEQGVYLHSIPLHHPLTLHDTQLLHRIMSHCY